MDSKFQLLSILAIGLASFHVILAKFELRTTNDILPGKGDDKLAGTPRLIGVGNFNGKLYFSDNTTELTWAQADALCKANFLTLVHIDSEAEAAYLKATLVIIYPAYWTSGRDSVQFTWGDGTNVTVTKGSGFRLCLYFTTINGLVYPWECEYKFRPLCQS